MQSDPWQPYETQSQSKGKGKGGGGDFPVVPELPTAWMAALVLLIFVIIRLGRNEKRG